MILNVRSPSRIECIRLKPRLQIDCKIQNDPETLFPQMAKIISYVAPQQRDVP